MTIEVHGADNRRYRVYVKGRFIAGYTIGDFRPYVYPLCTPSGLPVTEESPADHPHHQSVWLAQDQVNDVDFWRNAAGCGRVHGDAPMVSFEATSAGESAVFRHDLTWSTPRGDAVLLERRTTVISSTASGVLVDVVSDRRPAGPPVMLGATKEAGLGVRVLDMLDENDGGLLLNSHGHHGEAATIDRDADWVDYSGRLGRGTVGVAVLPHPANPRHPWFVRSYGVIVLNHHRFDRRRLEPDDHLILACRVVAHDGPAAAVDLAGIYRSYCMSAIDVSLKRGTDVRCPAQ